MTTYQNIIRSYSSTVASGHSDADLWPRQRRLTVALLNAASNAGRASVAYPPTDQTRDDVVKYLSDILWQSRHLVTATAPNAGDDLEVAIARAIAVLRGI